MNKLWVYVNGNWRRLGRHFGHGKPSEGRYVPEELMYEIADYRNQKYGKRHYWVSAEKPGTDELEQIRSAKKKSGLEFVDVAEEGGLA